MINPEKSQGQTLIQRPEAPRRWDGVFHGNRLFFLNISVTMEHDVVNKHAKMLIFQWGFDVI
jgi:hypothetical protein